MLLIIISTIFIATLLNVILKKINIPTIVGYIVTGIIIASVFHLQDQADNSNLKFIAEFGIVFLMFTIGLDFSLTHLFKMKKDVFLLGGLQFVISTLIIYLFMHYFGGFSYESSVIIASGLSMSSTAIVLKVLNENHDINKTYGQKVLGILLFQDLAVIPVLLLISLFSVIDVPFPLLLGKMIVGGVLLVGFIYFTGKAFLGPFLDKVSATNSSEIFIGAVLFIIIGSSYASHELGLSYSLGALLAGIMIAETHFRHQIQADLIPFRDLLLGIFFVTVGMQLNFQVILENLGTILSFLFFLVVIKVGVIYGIMRFVTKKITAVKTSLSLFQFGEFGIVIFELAVGAGLISHASSQVLVVTIIISMIITPFVLKHLGFLSDLLIRDRKGEYENIVPDEERGHIILVGYGRLGKTIAELLERGSNPYYILESDPKVFKEAKEKGKPIIYGNASQKHILSALRVDRAKTVIISIGNNEKLYLVCDGITRLAPHTQIIVKVNTYEEKEKLEKLKIPNIIVENEQTALSMFERIKG